MAKWKCSVCGAVVDGRGKKGHARIKDGKHDGEVTYTKVEVENETKNEDNVNVIGDSGIKESEIQTPDTGTDRPKDENTPPVQTNEINSIQIIDSNTGKKEKGIVDQVLEKLFSDDLAPITTSILASLATRLQQPNNATEDGLLTAEDGTKHQMI